MRLPASVLSGVNYIGEVADEKETKELKDQLYSEDVDKFLVQADEAVRNGAADWDMVSKCAHIYYYRTYFEKENQSAVGKATEWIIRALNMNPLHMDLTMKYAEMLAAAEDYGAAVAILERLVPQPEAPVLVRQWLGFYLRYLPDRLDDAIRYSEDYHRIIPDESDSYFTVAYSYAAKYCGELSESKQVADLQSTNRQKALSKLTEALRDQPEMKEHVRSRWTQPGRGFECLLHDKEFRALVGLPDEPATGSAAVTRSQSI